jgi:hypothetical protein
MSAGEAGTTRGGYSPCRVERVRVKEWVGSRYAGKSGLTIAKWRGRGFAPVYRVRFDSGETLAFTGRELEWDGKRLKEVE